jgi:hypothetical protein
MAGKRGGTHHGNPTACQTDGDPLGNDARAARRRLFARLQVTHIVFPEINPAPGVSYNTWRNELTEYNRNVRQAGFEILVTWGADWAALGRDEPAAQRVSSAIDEVREATLETLSVWK